MSTLLNPKIALNEGSAYFRLYNSFDICIPIKAWQFLCENRWFTDNPEEVMEAEFGLYAQEMPEIQTRLFSV